MDDIILWTFVSGLNVYMLFNGEKGKAWKAFYSFNLVCCVAAFGYIIYQHN